MPLTEDFGLAGTANGEQVVGSWQRDAGPIKRGKNDALVILVRDQAGGQGDGFALHGRELQADYGKATSGGECYFRVLRNAVEGRCWYEDAGDTGTSFRQCDERLTGGYILIEER